MDNDEKKLPPELKKKPYNIEHHKALENSSLRKEFEKFIKNQERLEPKNPTAEELIEFRDKVGVLSIAIKSLNDAIGKYGAKSENSYVNVVYDESDNPIAFDMFTFDEDGQRASSHIVVGIESQGKGIGSQLLDKRHEHLKELGFKSYEIWGMSEQFENLLKKNEIKYKRNIDEDTITIFIED